MTEHPATPHPRDKFTARLMSNLDGQKDAQIDALVRALTTLANAEALAGVRSTVAGWNGEDREEPFQHRHPDNLGATLPKTRCKAVYDLDEALQEARRLIASVAQRQAQRTEEQS